MYSILTVVSMLCRLLCDEQFTAFYPERVVFIAGAILNVVHAQSEISRRLFELRCRDRVRALCFYYSQLFVLFETIYVNSKVL